MQAIQILPMAQALGVIMSKNELLEFFKSNAYNSAIDNYKNSLFVAWTVCEDKEKREDIWREMKVLNGLQSNLINFINQIKE